MISIETGLPSLGLTPGPDQIERLLAFGALLKQWNRVYNLTSIPASQTLTHHLLDSLAIVPHLGTPGSIVDVGSGGGLPGIPLAIWFPDTPVTLVDSNGKKTRFLEQARISLSLTNVTVVQSRIESFEGSFEIVTSRAFSSLAEFSRLTAHLLSAGGRLAAMKGVLEDEEIGSDLSPLVLDKVIELRVPGIPAERHLALLRHPQHGPQH